MRESLANMARVMEAIPQPKGSAYASMERFVLDQGRPYLPAKLTVEERSVVADAVEGYRILHERFLHRQCFSNSQWLVFCDLTTRMVYVEGYAWSAKHYLVPTLHGWVAINGKVIDVTLPQETEGVLPPEPEQAHGEFDGRAYYGVPFLRSYISRRARVTGGRGTLIDDWENQYPLLRTGGIAAVRRRP